MVRAAMPTEQGWPTQENLSATCSAAQPVFSWGARGRRQQQPRGFCSPALCVCDLCLMRTAWKLASLTHLGLPGGPCPLMPVCLLFRFPYRPGESADCAFTLLCSPHSPVSGSCTPRATLAATSHHWSGGAFVSPPHPPWASPCAASHRPVPAAHPVRLLSGLLIAVVPLL